MTRKKLSREERRRRRRKAIERKRRETGWEPPPTPSIRRKDEVDEADEVFEDMLPLFPRIDDLSASPLPAMEQLMMALVDSGYMADEPEFEEIIISPMLCANTFVEVAEELDIDPDSLDELSLEDQEDAKLSILEGTIERLLTDELRQDITDGLNDLRLRLKRSGDREEVAKAAALQLFLGDDANNEIWPMIGLVQAIFRRSLIVGFELIEASMEAMQPDSPDESDVPLPQRLAQSSAVQKAEALLKKVPGLRGFLEKQADEKWEEGTEAMFMGELYLELYSPEELGMGFDIVKTTVGYDAAQETATQDSLQLEIPQEKLMALISRLDDYITELFTPERLDQLRARLDAILKDPAYAKKWLAFLYMLTERMADKDAVEYEKRFLIQALLGEMGVAAQAFQEDSRNGGEE